MDINFNHFLGSIITIMGLMLIMVTALSPATTPIATILSVLYVVAGIVCIIIGLIAIEK